MKEKTEQGRSVNLRLTQSEYAEYIRLGGVKWMRMFLQMSAGIHKLVAAKECNFCSRCGKRTADLKTIHTCTPPRGQA